MKVVVSENKFNSTLSNTISDMVISQLKSREKIPDNLYGINVDAHDSKYGKMCHITYLFNDSISGYDSYAMRPIQLVVRRNIKTLFKDVFRGGFYDSLKSMNDFDKPDLIRPIRESKMRSKKIIITESQFKLINENYSSFELRSAINTLEKIIKNFDEINCEDEYFDEEYKETYCRDFQGDSKEKLIKIKDSMKEELNQVMNRSFRNSNPFN